MGISKKTETLCHNSRFSKISFLKILKAEKREIVAARFSFLGNAHN